ncbi:hypothetical protein FPOAC2_04303 [Fusarium poae]|uniref:hypothetical protein n=1 Tax=Fusarium poae TaxID=36050 RepID=UPI001CE7BE75|nr:hypothetical protein FPOAC1_004233 [Fusarium poae]KAG8670997.1 hypothetical protein FPOAC1_004233 [Fusarium poae]
MELFDSVTLPYSRDTAQLPGPLPSLEEIHNPANAQFSPRRSQRTTRRGGVCLIRGIYIVKHGPDVSEYEGNVLLFLEQHGIPAPRLYAMYKDESSGHLYLIMECIKGVSLKSVRPSLSVEHRSSIATQLKGMLDHIRSLEPPSDFIGSIDGTGLRDYAFQTMDPDPDINGPFKTPEEVGSALSIASRKLWEQFRQDIWLPRFFSEQLSESLKNHSVTLTHGDLHEKNIMVEKISQDTNSGINGVGERDTDEYRVTGIVDWDSAGWYPAYWEYASTLAGVESTSEWPDQVGKILKPYPLEYSMIVLVFLNLQLIY